MLRLVQLRHANGKRLVAVVEEPWLRPLVKWPSVFELAMEAIQEGGTIQKVMAEAALGDSLDYESVYEGRSEWRLSLPIDHPDEPARCLVTGTGLTHKAS